MSTDHCWEGPSSRGVSCCGSSKAPGVIDYMELGLRRSRSEMLPVVGSARTSCDGLDVQFSLEVDGDVITSVSFRASFCSALIAYCELLAERAEGSTVRRAARIRFGDLISALPGIPPGKHDRARLALLAWWSALSEAEQKGK